MEKKDILRIDLRGEWFNPNFEITLKNNLLSHIIYLFYIPMIVVLLAITYPLLLFKFFWRKIHNR